MALMTAVFLTSCHCGDTAGAPDWLRKGIETASSQLLSTAEAVEGTGLLPQHICVDADPAEMSVQLGRDPSSFIDKMKPRPNPDQLGTMVLCKVYNWTSGFFPGSLWYLYELTGDPKAKAYAEEFTNLLSPLRYYKGTHDLGFMVGSSYGNAMRLSPSDTVKAVLIEAADNLASRFDPEIGCIRSWDFGTWNFPVIIDNMMNLELLFYASRLSGNPRYRDIAVRHANKTMLNHFRDDFTSYHVVSYNSDGTIESRGTYQGRNDDSAWARGQAWAVYGYTVCFRETGDTAYLTFAQNIADMIMKRVSTADAVPYWDYDAPALPQTPRDASAAAITASALLELSTFVPASKSKEYFAYAEKILKNLSSKDYLASPGTNCGFVLMHSVGSLPHGSQIDTPLTYADYYYIEALERYKTLLQKKGTIRTK